MPYSEEIIWDTISESAKNRFDFNSFSQQFNHIEDDIADYILFTLIESLANKEKDDIIQLKILNQTLVSGFYWKEDNIKSFIKGKDELLKLEINASKIAYNLLSEGSDSNEVLKIVKELINTK